MGRYSEIRREEELKNKIAQDFFDKFDCTEVIGNIDFAVRIKRPQNSLDFHNEYFLWAEAKKAKKDIRDMLAQLILTIGNARTFDSHYAPPFLGCFDSEKITFIPYDKVQEIFYINDFNWKVTSSNPKSKEFKLLHGLMDKIDAAGLTLTYDFEKDAKRLKTFIKDNFDLKRQNTHKTKIDKNNFINIYNRWTETVKPAIAINWPDVKKLGILDGDFYLADLFSAENKTLLDKLFVLLKDNHYEADRHISGAGLFTSSTVEFKDGQKAHNKFWAIYERPPRKEYWDYIIKRRDRLVPQDIRERKGSFFTPQIWVELSQKYIADVFGEDWQDEYYVWDCAAGTGNLLAGLTNEDNIWASTLDKADVDVMHERIQNGVRLLEGHCFQFDFLNDDFSKLPKGLQNIIKKTPEKLIIYINPPYAEGDAKIGRGRTGAHESIIHDKYQNVLGKASAELFALFLIRIYKEIPHCKIANFAKLKALCASNFSGFRENVQAKLEKLFVVPADTFDNVTGDFPIGFHIWDTAQKTIFKKITADVYDRNGMFLRKKAVFSYDDSKYISDWLEENSKNIFELDFVGHLASVGNDFQHQRDVYIDDVDRKRIAGGRHTMISVKNLIAVSVYFTVRHGIEPTWLNDRDQFLYPKDEWEKDIEFQNDCLAFTLFHNNNNISIKYGVNHWIPFSEKNVNARDTFDSHFMLSFIGGKIIQNGYSDLFEQVENKMCIKREFSPEAQAVFNAGQKLWKHYHKQPYINVNASFYDIREYFQGRNDKGRMNATSKDEKYTELIADLRSAMKILTKKIEPKIYEYGFLRK